MSVEPVRIRPQALFGIAALAGCVLLALLGLELHAAPGRPQADVVLPVRSDTAPSGTVRDASASLPPGVVADATRIVLARPLFSPQRRPASVAVSGPQRPRLAGIIVAPGGRRAIFAGAGDARGLVVGVGQQAGAWHVMAIDDSGVRVSGPDGMRVLHPSRDNSGPGGTAATADALPPHPSILDILRSRNALPSGGGLARGLMGGQLPIALPPPQNTDQQSPQPTAPAAPE